MSSNDSKNLITLIRDDNKLFDLIELEINKKYTFKRLCKDFEKDSNINNNDFSQTQCFYMCNPNIQSISQCNKNSIDDIMIKSRQIKKLKILKKTFVNNEELSLVSIASTTINDIENKVIIKDFNDEYEMLYELFISNILKSDPIIEKHICGYYGKKSDNFKLLLEYIQGKTLTELKNITMKEFSDIMSQIFLILNYANIKYGFLHGDLHTENFLIIDSKNKDLENKENLNENGLFYIELPLSNGKIIKYESRYKVVFLDFGLSFIQYKFNTDQGVKNIRLIPLEQETTGFENFNPLVDITKLFVFIMIEMIYENKHKKLSEIGVFITNLIQYLYSIIGRPNENINSSFYDKSRMEYGYIYDLINANLEYTFEELYIKFVSGNVMDIHNISKYFNKEDFEELEGKSLRDELEDTEMVMNIIYNITNENIKLNDKIDKIVELVKDIKNIKRDNKNGDKPYSSIKRKFSEEQLKYIYLNLFQYTCKYELNKNVFIDENDMILNVNKIYNKFIDNKIIYKNIKSSDKYKVVDNLIEFKLNKFLDLFLVNTDIHNILNKYNKLTVISNEQIENLDSQKLNKTLKTLLIKNYNKLPSKIFQKNFINNEINVKKFNTIEQIKFISNIVFQLKKQMNKLDIDNIRSQIRKGIKPVNVSNKSQVHHLQLFFYNLYKYCEKYSLDIIEKSKIDFIDWISYNRIILYDYYIRHISLLNIPEKFSKVYLQFLELEDEIWEKFYKKDNFETMSNSLTFSENMLQLIINKDLPNLIKKLVPNNDYTQSVIDLIKNDIKNIDINDVNKIDIINPFKKLYFD
jgi:hypothetical protein